MRYLSLFSGIGGFDLAFDRAGMECAGQVEIDAACNALLSRYWPDVWRCDDVRKVNRGNAPAVDLVCGGFPCQDVSVAGRRAGLAGERSGLWFEFRRILADLGPAWAVIENVPGLLSSNGGRDFAAILRGLGELGYLTTWRVFDAQYFGVAQRRRRVFLVASLGNGCAAQVLFEREGVPGDSAPRRETGEGVATGLTAGTSAGSGVNPPGRRREDDVNLVYQCHGNNVGEMGTLRQGNGGLTGGVPFVALGISENQRSECRLTDISRQLTSGGGKPGQGYPAVMVAHSLSCEGADASEDGTGRGTPLVAFSNRGVDSPTFETVRADCNGALPMTAVASGVRRLTPTECERLQGFPDGWTRMGKLSDLGDTQRDMEWHEQSDSARYRQLGNAVCVPVVEWIGRRIVEVAHA